MPRVDELCKVRLEATCDRPKLRKVVGFLSSHHLLFDRESERRHRMVVVGHFQTLDLAATSYLYVIKGNCDHRLHS